jgi:hypothetical protein
MERSGESQMRRAEPQAPRHSKRERKESIKVAKLGLTLRTATTVLVAPLVGLRKCHSGIHE